MARRAFGSLRKRASGKWQARYTDRNGKLVSAPKTFDSKTAAHRWLAQQQADMDRGRDIDHRAGKLLFDTYSADWLKTRRVKGSPLAPRTRELYEHQLDRHILPYFTGWTLAEIQPADVRSWHTSLRRECGDSSTVPPKVYRLLRAIMQTAFEDELIPRNPVMIRGAGQEASSDRPMFTTEQIEKLIETIDDRWKAVIVLACWGSLRLGEIAALARADLDLAEGTVTVRRAVTDIKGEGRTYKAPKSAAGARTVALPPHVLPLLQDHLNRFTGPADDALVIVGPKDGPLRGANFGAKVWRPLVAEIGLPDGSRLHDLRGVGASLAARAGATTKELMYRLGHASPDLAMRYQRAERERDAEVAQRMTMAREWPKVSETEQPA